MESEVVEQTRSATAASTVEPLWAGDHHIATRGSASRVVGGITRRQSSSDPFPRGVVTIYGYQSIRNEYLLDHGIISEPERAEDEESECEQHRCDDQPQQPGWKPAGGVSLISVAHGPILARRFPNGRIGATSDARGARPEASPCHSVSRRLSSRVPRAGCQPGSCGPWRPRPPGWRQ